jgi:hypothetical protein
MHAQRRHFLQLSAEVTGYSPTDLEGTGLVDEYLALLQGELGAEVMGDLDKATRHVLSHRRAEARARAMQLQILASPVLWPVVAGIVQLWYLGSWTSMSTQWYALAGFKKHPPGVKPGKSRVPSAQAYEQQLSFRGAGAHPPGAKPTGHGSWSMPPVFGDVPAPPAATPRRNG